MRKEDTTNQSFDKVVDSEDEGEEQACLSHDQESKPDSEPSPPHTSSGLIERNKDNNDIESFEADIVMMFTIPKGGRKLKTNTHVAQPDQKGRLNWMLPEVKGEVITSRTTRETLVSQQAQKWL